MRARDRTLGGNALLNPFSGSRLISRFKIYGERRQLNYPWNKAARARATVIPFPAISSAEGKAGKNVCTRARKKGRRQIQRPTYLQQQPPSSSGCSRGERGGEERASERAIGDIYRGKGLYEREEEERGRLGDEESCSRESRKTWHAGSRYRWCRWPLSPVSLSPSLILSLSFYRSRSMHLRLCLYRRLVFISACFIDLLYMKLSCGLAVHRRKNTFIDIRAEATLDSNRALRWCKNFNVHYVGRVFLKAFEYWICDNTRYCNVQLFRRLKLAFLYSVKATISDQEFL